MTEKLGPYEVIEELGRGAMAVVWRGFDPALDRAVAIKEPKAPHGATERVVEEFHRRFVREAKAVARLNHPGIVSVYAAGVFDDRPAMVMELVEGSLLTELLENGRLMLSDSISIIEQLLDAMAYAHERGVIHRDLKPDNVFVTPSGQVKLADFGVAHLGGDGGMTTVGTILGTPAYMSPEQVKGHPINHRTDLFSIGVIAYALLTGINPFSAAGSTTIATILYRITQETPHPPHELNPNVPPRLSSVVMKALEKDVDSRWDDAQSMRTAWLAAAVNVQDSPVPQRRSSPGQPDSALEQPPTVIDSPEALQVPDEPDTTHVEVPEGTLLIPHHAPDEAPAIPPMTPPAPAPPPQDPPPTTPARPSLEPTPPRPGSTQPMPVPEPREVPAKPRNKKPLLLIALAVGAITVSYAIAQNGASQSNPEVSTPVTEEATPRIQVPDVTGSTWSETEILLAEAGLVATSTTQDGAALGEPAKRYKVLSQEPAAGQMVEQGETVTVALNGPQETSLEIKVSDSSIVRGQAIRIVATLTNAEGKRVSDEKVTLQWSTNKKAWKRIATAKTTKGAVSRSWKPTSTGTFHVRAVHDDTTYWMKSASTARKVTVKKPYIPPPPPKKPRVSTGFQ